MVDCTDMSCCGRDSIVAWSTWFSKLASCGVGSVVMGSSCSGPGEELEEEDVVDNEQDDHLDKILPCVA